MADRTSAEIFGTIFGHLAEWPVTAQDKDFALYIYGLSQGYDFSPCQMDADGALEKLGLARRDPVTDEMEYGLPAEDGSAPTRPDS